MSVFVNNILFLRAALNFKLNQQCTQDQAEDCGRAVALYFVARTQYNSEKKKKKKMKNL